MKSTLWYLAAGLEVWVGVFGILLGLFVLMSVVESPAELRTSTGVVWILAGALLVSHAIRRELKRRVDRQMESFGSPLDSPTQA